MRRKAIITPDAPLALGSYSQAIEAGEFLEVSGQVGLNTENKLVGDTAAEQTWQIMENIRAILGAAACNFGDVVKTDIFLTDANDFYAVNEIYEGFLTAPYPARACVVVSEIPLPGAKVEISVRALAAEQPPIPVMNESC